MAELFFVDCSSQTKAWYLFSVIAILNLKTQFDYQDSNLLKDVRHLHFQECLMLRRCIFSCHSEISPDVDPCTGIAAKYVFYICHVLTLVPFVCFYFRLVREWVGVGILCFVLVFLFLCVWPGMVPRQRQLWIVVSDWEPYLGSLFPPGFVGSCFLFFCLHQTELFRLFSLFCNSIFGSA